MSFVCSLAVVEPGFEYSFHNLEHNFMPPPEASSTLGCRRRTLGASRMRAFYHLESRAAFWSAPQFLLRRSIT